MTNYIVPSLRLYWYGYVIVILLVLLVILWETSYRASRVAMRVLRLKQIERFRRQREQYETKTETGNFTLAEFEKRFGDRYGLVELKPNLMPRIDVERLPVYVDEHGIIVAGTPSNGIEAAFAYVASIANRSQRGGVAAVDNVMARLVYDDLSSDRDLLPVDRGHWLSEKETQVDFPPNGTPHRLVLAIEKVDRKIYAVRRDLETRHTGPKATFEQLDGDLYRITTSLLQTTGPHRRQFKYILTVDRKPEFKVEISTEYLWLIFHLSTFRTTGFNLSRKAYAISSERHEKAVASNYTEPALSEAKSEENKKRAELAETVQEWIDCVGAFLQLAYDKEKSEKFFKAIPTTEQGLQREAKLWMHLIHLSPPKEKETAVARNWDLTDAINVRLDQLEKAHDALTRETRGLWF